MGLKYIPVILISVYASLFYFIGECISPVVLKISAGSITAIKNLITSVVHIGFDLMRQSENNTKDLYSKGDLTE